MIISWRHDDELSAEPGEYDAFPPVGSLRIGTRPMQLSPDREAIASYLAFGAWNSGDLALPRAVSPATAEAIEADAIPVRVRPRDIRYVPMALPRGRRTVDLVFDRPGTDSPAETIAVVPTTGMRGALAAGRSMTIASNAFALDAAAETGSPCFRARLAVAVFFSEDMEVDALHLQVDSSPCTEEAVRLRALLSSVNLGLHFVPASG